MFTVYSNGYFLKIESLEMADDGDLDFKPPVSSHFSLYFFKWATLRIERGAKERNHPLYKPYSNGNVHLGVPHFRACPAAVVASRWPHDSPFQLSLPRRTPLWRRRSRRSDRAGATKTWPPPLSSRCPTSSISLGEEWRASWMTRWPSVSRQRSWRPGTC